jgi:cytochrome c556
MTRKLAFVTALALGAGVLGVGVLGVGATAHAQGIDPIQVRQAGMDLVAGTLGGVKAVVTANGDVKTLENPGKWIQRWGTVAPTLFVAGSDKGNTKAAPAIWTDMAGFQKAAATLSAAGGELATAAKAGDATAVAAAFKAIGDACAGCHKDYRLK